MKTYKELLQNLARCEKWLQVSTAELQEMKRERQEYMDKMSPDLPKKGSSDSEKMLKSVVDFNKKISEKCKRIGSETLDERILKIDLQAAINETRKLHYDQESGFDLIVSVAKDQGISPDNLSERLDIYSVVTTTQELINDGSDFSKCILARQRSKDRIIPKELITKVNEMLGNEYAILIESLLHLREWFDDYLIAKQRVAMQETEYYENPSLFRIMGANDLEREYLSKKTTLI